MFVGTRLEHFGGF